ncbi:MAG: HAMP domain-containing protein [Fibrobacteria bacterium]|nr:HAMP domain-containing protein [Fibrobacteria bacterium]
MNYVSIGDKFVSITKKLLFANLGLFLFVFISGTLFLTFFAFRDAEKYIEKSISDRGLQLVGSSSIALRGMVEDNAFTSVRELMFSSVQRDKNIQFGVFIDQDETLWAFSLEHIPDSGITIDDVLSDSTIKWAKDVLVPSFRVSMTKRELYEFAAPVMHERTRLGTVIYGYSTASMKKTIHNKRNVVIIQSVAILVVQLLLGVLLYLWSTREARNQANSIVSPLFELTKAAHTISSGDYASPVTTTTNDEVGELARNFESMRTTIYKYTTELEQLVEERTGELREAQRELLDKAHKEGMAEIATNTLHNIGNILNSVHTSLHMARETMDDSYISGFIKANALLRENMDDLERFIVQDPKGKNLMHYYLKLEDLLSSSQKTLQTHFNRLNDKIQLICDVVATQQNYAGYAGMSQDFSLADIIHDALTMQKASLDRLSIIVEEDLPDVPKIAVVKTKVIHILINLVTNAKDAMMDVSPDTRKIYISLTQEESRVILKIRDTGCGLSKKELEKVFVHGYSTKKSGHGFGLHSCANYMTEMRGDMYAESEGQGKGATFVLRFPLD